MDDDNLLLRCVVTNTVGSVNSESAKLTIGTLVNITLHPEDATCQPSNPESVFFYVEATAVGGPAPTYQWQRLDGENWADLGAGDTWAGDVTTDTLTITDQVAAAQHLTSVRCNVSSGGSSTASNAATLNIDSRAPTIAPQPANAYAGEGKVVAVFTTNADLYDSIQWQYNSGGGWTNGTDAANTAFSGWTTGTLSTTASVAATHHNWQFRVIYTRAGGASTTSNAVTLTVGQTPSITTHPAAKTIRGSGTTANVMTIAANTRNGGTLTYQWQYNSGSGWANLPADANWSGTRSTSFGVGAGVNYTHTGWSFRCAVSNTEGTVYSNSAVLTINNNPTITTHPSSKTITGAQINSNVLSVAANTRNGGTLTYQWQYWSGSAWTNISSSNNQYSGENTANLSTTASLRYTHSGRRHRCIVTNPIGTATSNEATLTIWEGPLITSQPSNKTITGATTSSIASVSVNTRNGGTLSYRWQEQIGGTWYNISNNQYYQGATGATLSAGGSLRWNHSGRAYRCIITNSAGNITSGTMTLTIREIPTRTNWTQLNTTMRALESNDTGLFRHQGQQRNGGGTMRVEWQFAHNNLSNWTNADGHPSFRITGSATNSELHYNGATSGNVFTSGFVFARARLVDDFGASEWNTNNGNAVTFNF
ncbi:fibronectin type III domain protein [Vibrio maritimus]|uniref:Fibronectin type III domain protein n=1 Tax=Vibrio maritimus TaxID=990268 RepID=A0A090SGD4_9VIBR|nr:fibronectin type III domain protein [Vibrio maritimus]